TQVTVRDFNGKVVFNKTHELLLKPSSSYEYKLTIPGQETQGFFGVGLAVHENGLPLVTRTYSFCVAKQAEKPDPFFGFSAFGPVQPECSRAVNAGSIGLFMHWMWVEEKKGVIDFTRMDKRLSKWTEQGIEPVGMFYSAFDARQFNIPGWLYKDIMEWRKNNKEPFPDYYYDAWSNFVKATVKHYKGRINIWSIVGEYDGLPYLACMSERVSSFDHFVRITRVIATAVKEADPDAVIGGIGVSGVDSQNNLVVAEKYWQKTGDVLDSLSFNPYVSPNTFGPGSSPIGEERGNLRGILHRARDIAGTTGKRKISIDEKGYMIDTSLPVDSPYAKDMAKVAARGFIVAKSVPEVSHYLYYIAYSDWEPDPPLRTDFYMWKKEGPRPVVASYAAVARLLAGAAEPVEVSIHKDILVYVFRQGNRSTAALWTVLKEPVSLLADLPAAVESYDVMGNRTGIIKAGRRELLLTDSPIYLSSSAKPGELAAALQKGKFSLPLIKAEAAIADIRTLNIHVVNQTDREIKAKVEPAPVNGINWQAVTQGDITVPAKGNGMFTLRPERGNILDLSGREFTAAITVEGRKTVIKKYLAPYRVSRLQSKVTVDGSLAEYKELPSIVLNNTDSIFPSGVDILGSLWMGPEDLSMKVWLAYDDSNLYFAAEVADDVHVQDKTGVGIWAGDGFAIGIDTLNDARSSEISGAIGYDANDYDFGIALTSAGPQAHMWTAAAENERLKGDAVADYLKPVIVQAGLGKWNYELAIPWDCIKPLTCKPGSAFACNFAYMDVDVPKGGWSYWMSLTRGIIGSKDPAMFKTFILE
ncbi:MAG: sugar-binding protein, partial [bacterium]|nr:sugar-binding protein [bacterium]